jgi:hypothetical protein
MKRRILTTLFLTTIFALSISGQEFDLARDQNCDPLVVPPKCQAVRQGFKDEIERVDASMQHFQDRLQGAGPGLKAQLLRIIRQKEARRRELVKEMQTAYEKCLSDHGATPRPLAAEELTATLTGTGVLRVDDSNTPDPFTIPIDLDLRFTRNRCAASITRFAKVTMTTRDLDIVGRIDIEVTQTRGGIGTFHPVTGELNVPITVDIHYDTDWLSDDVATFSLTTGNSVSPGGVFDRTGAPLSAGGNITLVGTTRFREGYLEGKDGSLVINANLSPQPN